MSNSPGEPGYAAGAVTLGAGVHDDVPGSVYHSDPAPEPSLSASIAQVIVEASPRHAFVAHPRLNPAFERDEDSALDKGAAAHTILLGRGKTIEPVDAADWRTKAAKEARDAARAASRTPILARDHEAAIEMARVARQELAHIPGCERAFLDGVAERVLVWREPCGIWCRAMLDWTMPDGDVFDYKSGKVSANPMLAGKRAAGMGWDLKQAFYLRGLNALGQTCRNFRYVQQENYPPYAVSVIELDKELIHFGARAAKYAIDKFAECLKGGHWPSYPPLVHRAGAPAWAMSQRVDREVYIEDTDAQVRDFSVRSQEPIR